tara:strand:+ start:1 stop:933 length:933 start_codon:yes stop_codon:yes gene_type:complete
MLSLGGLSSKLARTLIKKFKDHPKVKKIDKEIEEHKKWIDEGGPESERNEAMKTYGTSESDLNYRDLAEMSDEFAEMELSMLHQEKIQILKDLEAEEVIGEIERNPYPNREDFQEGGNVDAQMAGMMEGPTHTMPDGTVMPGATHGEYEAMMPEEGMVPDEEMEEDYVEFIMSEALEPEEQQYLSERLVEDDQLSMIFDKVVETASEFSGSGPVDGPGTGISDSIPARLSDGEFVMTAKATDAIGADTLDELMALAEQEADAGRQMKAIGGEAKSEVEKLSSTVIEEDPINRKNKEVMRALDPRLTLFAS